MQTTNGHMGTHAHFVYFSNWIRCMIFAKIHIHTTVSGDYLFLHIIQRKSILQNVIKSVEKNPSKLNNSPQHFHLNECHNILENKLPT